MAEIAFSFTSVPSLKSHTGDANWTDISDATIGDAIFTSGKSYLIYVNAQVGGSATGAGFGIRTLHGTTAFGESVFSFDPGSTLVGLNNYGWFTVWEAVTDEGIKLQFTTQSSTETVQVDFCTIFSMNLTDDLTKDTDWHFNENASDHTMESTYGNENDATITFTPGTADDDWLVMSYCQINPQSANVNYFSALDRSGEATSTLPELSQEVESTSIDEMMLPIIRVFSLGAAENIFKAQAKHDTTGDKTDVEHGAVFALNLDMFVDQVNVYSEVSTLLSSTDWATEVQSATMTPSATGNVWSGGWWRTGSAVGKHVNSRLQIDNADSPPGQTAAVHELADAWDSTDQLPVFHQSVDNLDNSAHTFDVDGSLEDTDTWAIERSIFAVSMELVAAASSSQTTRDLTESFSFSDDLARDFWGDRQGADIRDIFTFSDSFTADLILIRELSDTVATLSDSISRQCELLRRPQDSNVLVDTITRDLDLVRELQDTSTFSDALDALLINIRELQDTLTFSDELARDQDLVRLVQDTLTLIENLDRTNTGDTDTVADHHRFKLWQNLRRWRLYKPRDQIH